MRRRNVNRVRGMEKRKQSLFNALPPAVTALAVVIGGIEVLFWMGAAGMLPNQAEARTFAIQHWSYFAPLWNLMIEHGMFSPKIAIRSLSYALIHTSPLHAGLVLMFILGMGNIVGRHIGARAILVLFFGSAFAGSLAYWLVQSEAPLIGGYPAVFGMIGAYSFILWARIDAAGGPGYAAFSLIALLLGLQLLFWLFTGQLDWIADLAGFCAGFLLFAMLRPGGWNWLLAKLRLK